MTPATDALTPIPPGHLAAVVTFLEMRARPSPRPMPATPLQLARWKAPSPARYRALFERVGAPWLWFSRLILGDAALEAIILDPAREIHAVLDRQGIEVGLLELDFRFSPACELAFFGLIPELTGKGLGRWLMAQALALGWRKGIERLWLHSCTLDHPSALNFYRAQGFTAYDRKIELFPDPRLSGILPRQTAPHVPLIVGEAAA